MEKLRRAETELANIHEEVTKNVSLADACYLVRQELQKLRAAGIHEVDAIDLNERTALPFEFIAKVMNELEQEGVVS